MRFREFTDDWNNIILDDVAKFSKGKSISKNDISKDGLECVRYGELYTKYNEIINNIASKTNLNENELILSDKNDILIPCSGETAIDLATASCITKDHVAIGGDITIIKTNQYAPFIAYYLNQKKTEIAKYAQGVSVVHLYSKDFKILKMKIPSINEQEKIISFIEKISQKEQFLKQKYEHFLEFKKYLLQNIFSQKLRFANFEEEWISKKLGDIIVSVSSGKTNVKEKDVPNGTNPIYGSKGVIGHMDSYDYDDDYILIARVGAYAGYIYEVKGKCGVTDNTLMLKTSDSLEKSYLFYYLKNYDLNRLIFGSGQPLITGKELKNINVLIPSMDEQKKISNCLRNADKKINLIQNQISEMEIFKKGLLQQMFEYLTSKNNFPINQILHQSNQYLHIQLPI